MSSPLRVIHVVAGLDPAFGGPSYSVPRLCRALATSGAELTLLSVAGAKEVSRESVKQGYEDHRFDHDYARIPILRGLRSSGRLKLMLRQLAHNAEVVHDHGLWLMPNIHAGWAAAAARKPLVVSPRGMLSPAALQFSLLKKKASWYVVQRAMLRSAACIHATSEQESEEIRAVGLTNPIAIIPNGMDLPEPAPEIPGPPTAERVVLSLGRIHPKKGLARLLHAWAKIETRYPNWKLRIAGPSEAGHADELGALAGTLGLTHVLIDGPIFEGDAKWQAYRSASLFVLPTLNENFGITVAEALAAGIPVISTRGAPWSRLESEGCGWWIDHGVDPLAATLDRAMAMPRQVLTSMGAKGRTWIAREFSWEHMAREMLEMYRWLSRTAAPPGTLRFG